MSLSNLIRKTISDKIVRMKGTDLKAKSARAVMALGIGTFLGRGLRLTRNMILARILAPDQFGLMAIINIVSIAFEAFTEVGIKQSVIQNKNGADPDYLNMAWWMQAIRGSGLFLIALVMAPWIEAFYDKPVLRLLQFSFLAVLFRGFISPRAYVLEKEYRFGVAVFLIQGSSAVSTILTIVLALVIRNVWALVIGFVAEFVIMCVMSHMLVPFRPRFKIHREHLRELLRFARGMFGLPILAMIGIQTDVIVLGKLVTDEELGMYYLVVGLTHLPIELFARMICPVLLPAFSQKQDDKSSLRRGVLKVTRLMAIFSIPLVALMAANAGAVLFLSYGAKYTAVTVPCAILCLGILAGTSGSVFSTMYIAMGQPHLHRRFVVVRAVIIVALIYPAIVYFGLLGAAGVVVIGHFAAVYIQVLRCRRVIDLTVGQYIRCNVPGLLLALPVIAAVLLARVAGVGSSVTILIISFVVLFASFGVGIYISEGFQCVLRDYARHKQSVGV